MISVVIADDHPMVREGLEAMLTSAKEFTVAATVSNGAAALEACAIHRPNLVLSDVRMPKMDGFMLLEQVKAIYPSTRLLLLAGMPLREEEVRAREMGAGGYLPKSVDQDVLTGAIRRICEDKLYFASEHFQEPMDSLLTAREVDVLRGMARGLQREKIAQDLGIGLESVKTHARNILAKLSASNATYAVARAYELGILRA